MRASTPGFHRRLLLTGLLLGSFSFPIASAAQSVVRGEIEGTVRDAFGNGIPSASLTVVGRDPETTFFLEANRSGAFLASMLEAGEYDLLVEALGYVPRLVQGIRLRPGQIVSLAVTLAATNVPPERVDTVRAGAAAQPVLTPGGGRWFTRNDLLRMPDPRMGLARIAALAPDFDGALGAEGLPGSMTVLYLDGIPLSPARHPLGTGGTDLPLLPLAALGYLDLHRRPDVEWSEGAAGTIAAGSRTALGERSAEGAVSGSAGPLWRSDALGDADSPDATNLWGEAAFHLPLDETGTRLFVAVEGGSLQAPRASALSTDQAARLVAARPPFAGADAAELTAPWTLETRALTGLGRLDWTAGDGRTSIMVRGHFATKSEEGSALFGTLPSPMWDAPGESTDLALAAAVLTEAHRLVTVEGRVGIERSTRDGPASEEALVPTTYFAEEGIVLGGAPELSASAERTTLRGVGVAHYRSGPHWLKGGLSASWSSHAIEHVPGGLTTYVFGPLEDVAGGRGLLRESLGGVPRSTFSIPEIGIFGQYRWDPAVGVRVTAGVRLDREMLPSGAIPAVPALDSLTTIRNDRFPSTLNKISPRVGVSWDLTGDGRTVVEGSVGAHFGELDPAAFAELVTLSGTVAQRERFGDVGSAWPSVPSAGSGQDTGLALSVFGPELQAPRTVRSTFGLSRRLGEATVLHLSGTIRRTEFLLRRDDLNLSPGATGTLADGRPVFGALAQEGSIVAAVPGSNRRLSAFGRVWALNPDGVSEYRGMTIAFEHSAGSGFDIFGSFTRSVTEDNLVGAMAGHSEARVVPRIPGTVAADWEAATSDFDIPNRVAAGVRGHFDRLEGITLSAVYRYQSGLPFTAGFRAGVDVNGDGSGHNDPAFVPQELGAVPAEFRDCLTPDRGRVATRNACRGPAVHGVDLHLSAGILRVGDSVGSITIDLFNLTDAELGVPDTALLLVDPAGSVVQNGTTGVTTLPVVVNPDFGSVTRSLRPGTLVRIGFRMAIP